MHVRPDGNVIVHFDSDHPDAISVVHPLDVRSAKKTKADLEREIKSTIGRVPR